MPLLHQSPSRQNNQIPYCSQTTLIRFVSPLNSPKAPRYLYVLSQTAKNITTPKRYRKQSASRIHAAATNYLVF